MSTAAGSAGSGSHGAGEMLKDEQLAGMTQEQIDRYWIDHVYKPHERQLTLRAVGIGMLLGGVLSAANLYIGLKVGWSLGMAITSTILAFAVMKSLHAAGILKAEFTMLENNTVASTSSAAGYFSSAGMVSAIPALFITTQRQLSWWELAWWMTAVSLVGIVMAVPMRRQMIDVDRLKFPSGTACAETIKAMHQSAGEAVAKAQALLWSALGAMAFEIPAQVEKFGRTVANPTFWGGTILWPFGKLMLGGKSLVAWSISLPTSLLMYGAGAIMGMRVAVSMGIAAVVLYAGIGPWLQAHGVVNVPEGPDGAYRSMLAWAVWPGVLGALAASLLHFALKWRSIVQSFGTLGKIARRGGGEASPMTAVEIPPSWFGWGMVLSTIFVAFAARVIFHIPIWMSVLAAALSFVLAIMAGRSTGETDVTPIGALGKITQLTFAGIHPGHYATNLMTASITAGAAAHTGDLLTDLKTGYLLGGAPRRQFIAQFAGIAAGAVFCVISYQIVVGDGSKLGSAAVPAPAAQTWAVVADLLAKGIEAKDRGPGEGVGTTLQSVSITKRPPGVGDGDTLRIDAGPNAGTYTIVRLERTTLVLDRDVPVATPDAKGDGEPFTGTILGADGAVKAQVHVVQNTRPQPALRFSQRPAGTQINDYVRVDGPDGEYFHQIRGLRGDVAWLDHAFQPGEVASALRVEKMTLPPYAMTATLIAILAGILLTLLEVHGPKGWRGYLPSITGIGVAFVITCHDSLAMTIGAIIAYVVARLSPKTDERYTVAVSSGIIAGASVAGLLLIFFSEILGWLVLG